MMFVADHHPKLGWRVLCNGAHLCRAISEQVARETAAAMNAYRAVNP